ncbi:transmembrane sensor [Pedobacter africanus]|uniref:Ferric-dicitrate binding protein FerR (Iron transport regulator) n=1 Tax=Pedobacter africanus TaxID=151894 RepID=A0ACC6KTT9_9SPHI|nr:FecR domain-containing protein [Pedobacter africanus]MDR6782754.1 ferric-dicitrate binding protein FerR (iron transport regulator) [Pedobacter africanus]
MTDQEAKALLTRYENKECTPEEKILVEGWYIHTLGTKNLPGGKTDLEGIEKEIWSNIATGAFPAGRKSVRLWSLIPVAAAAVALLVAGIWFFRVQDKSSRLTRYTTDIAPGRNKAILMLEDGKVINLSEHQKSVIVKAGQLAYADGTAVSISASQMAVIRTPRGGTYQISLADGTKVWLNAESSLKFPSSFTGAGQRKVILSGEAYFEVAKNRKQPFVVSSEKQEVQVLGTHFNISAYADEENVKTTLLEGAVRVNQTTIAPGEQSILKNGRMQVRKVNPEDAIDWKNGEFSCKNEPLYQIMQKIARWYDLTVVYAHPELKNITFSGSLSRYDHVSGVLSALEQAGTLRFKLTGRQIQVL